MVTEAAAEVGALIPAIEANQGLLSVLALLAALGIAVFEFLRAESSSSAIVRREIEGATWPIDRLLTLQLVKLDARADEETPGTVAEEWNRALTTCRAGMDAVRMRTLVPLLAVKLHTIGGRLDELQIADGQPSDRMRKRLAEVRPVLVAYKSWLQEVLKESR